MVTFGKQLQSLTFLTRLGSEVDEWKVHVFLYAKIVMKQLSNQTKDNFMRRSILITYKNLFSVTVVSNFS